MDVNSDQIGSSSRSRGPTQGIEPTGASRDSICPRLPPPAYDKLSLLTPMIGESFDPGEKVLTGQTSLVGSKFVDATATRYGPFKEPKPVSGVSVHSTPSLLSQRPLALPQDEDDENNDSAASAVNLDAHSANHEPLHHLPTRGTQEQPCAATSGVEGPAPTKVIRNAPPGYRLACPFALTRSNFLPPAYMVRPRPDRQFVISEHLSSTCCRPSCFPRASTTNFSREAVATDLLHSSDAQGTPLVETAASLLLPSARRVTLEPTTPRPLDPGWIEIDDISTWLKTCSRDHGTTCMPETSASQRALWLVDTVDKCLVPSSSTDYRYIALSYVWGRTLSIETRLANVSALQRPGVLAESPQAIIITTDPQGVEGHEEVIIPKTIRHAMKLVRLLGERYLWVDRLCIVQDDPAEKHGQISHMADIYAGAYATIIAANGWDADHGLRGIKGVTETRRLLSHDSMDDTSRDAEKEYLEALQPYESVWYSRGWTFQELFFSKRRIFFQYKVAVWECCCALWHEGTGTSGEIPLFGPSGGKAQKSRRQDVEARLRSMSPWGVSTMPTSPNLNQFLRMVNFYNIRNLSFPSDGLKAFSGVLTALTPTFSGGFIWGLPMALFDAALLWLPNDPLKRRRPGSPGPVAMSKTTDDGLPSWSWVGWEGSIESRSFVHSARCSMDRRSDPGWTTDLTRFTPLCDWTLVASADALISDTTSCRIPRPTIQFDPKISVTTSWTAPSSLPGRFLTTEAEVYTFRLGGHYEEAYEEDIDNHCADDDFSDDTGSARAYDGSAIVDADGNFVGVMLRTFHKMHSGYDGVGDGLQGRECELMLVSSSRMRWISYLEPGEAERKWKRHGRGRDSVAEHGAEESTVVAQGLDEVVQYNVLWIRREGNIAYREGVGRVSEKTWKRYQARKERIVLA